ncbi:MAG: HNH endonuclease signature motif containing protein [Bacteroidia bacterium]
MKSKRPPIPRPIQRSIRKKNLDVCCVCKERDKGTNLHHIDGNPANNSEDNIAVLCVQEHDQHHRPDKYDNSKHIELGEDKIREYKREWEQTVEECKSDNPKILAVVNGYGDFAKVHSVKLLIQNVDGKIIYQRLYHQHFETMNEWTNHIMEEVNWLGKKVPLTLIDKPLDIELCPCCSNSLSDTLDKNIATRLTADDWQQKSIGTIYINPTFPIIELTIFYGDENIYEAHLHKCQGTHLHFHSDKFEERTPIKKKLGIRTQATILMQKVLDVWKPGQIFIATKDKKEPTIIYELNLPDIWEEKSKRTGK